jgi:hypothetical protein
MDRRWNRSEPIRRMPLRVLAALACALSCLLAVSLAGQASASGQGTASGGTGAQQPAPPAAGAVSATLEECVTSAVQEQRAVAFSAEMTTVPGTMRMAMRIDLEERLPGDVEFHAVTAPGLGVWRPSDAKVKVYKYLKQVTNLSSPASYRGFVRFRWLSAKGHVIKRADRLTGKCLQPALAAEPGQPAAATGTAGVAGTGSGAPSA